jgi:hypothetical protein
MTVVSPTSVIPLLILILIALASVRRSCTGARSCLDCPFIFTFLSGGWPDEQHLQSYIFFSYFRQVVFSDPVIRVLTGFPKRLHSCNF